MSNFRVKASSCTLQILKKGFAEAFRRAQISQTELLILVSQINNAKHDNNLKTMLGEQVFNSLVKKRERCKMHDTSVELQPFDYILNGAHRAQGRTILIVNPAPTQINNISNVLVKNGQNIEVIAVEIQLDGELDDWVAKYNAKEL